MIHHAQVPRTRRWLRGVVKRVGPCKKVFENGAFVGSFRTVGSVTRNGDEFSRARRSASMRLGVSSCMNRDFSRERESAEAREAGVEGNESTNAEVDGWVGKPPQANARPRLLNPSARRSRIPLGFCVDTRSFRGNYPESVRDALLLVSLRTSKLAGVEMDRDHARCRSKVTENSSQFRLTQGHASAFNIYPDGEWRVSVSTGSASRLAPAGWFAERARSRIHRSRCEVLQCTTCSSPQAQSVMPGRATPLSDDGETPAPAVPARLGHLAACTRRKVSRLE